MRRGKAAAVFSGVLLSAVALTAAGCGSSGGSGSAAGSGGTIDIGLVVPLTGPYAETGTEQELGAQLAVKEINAAGGIKSLGGAKLSLVIRDAGATTADTVTAASSLLSSSNLVAGLGTGITSNTLALTEVTNSRQIPWMDFTFGDQLTTRGLKYVFITSPLQSTLDESMYPAFNSAANNSGVTIKKIAIIAGDNETSVQSAQDLSKTWAPKLNWQVPLNETIQSGSVTSGVASSLVSKIQSSGAQVLMVGSAPPDVVQIQKQEVAQGISPVPWLLDGAPFLAKSFLTDAGLKGVQDMVAVASAGVYPSDEALAKKITAGGQIPNEYNLVPYSEVYMLADALEAAKSTNHSAVRDAIANLNIKGGPAGSVWPCDCMKFNSMGRTSTSVPTLQQWQNGVPVTVYPQSVAQAKLSFPTS
jgi:branched-chain amino acid transport system substrate-binding protein